MTEVLRPDGGNESFKWSERRSDHVPAPTKGIYFGSLPNGQDIDWCAMNRQELVRKSRCGDYTSAERVYFAALARVNKIGHALFERDELEDILGHDEDQWTRKLAGRSTVTDAIRRLKKRGDLDPSSDVRCLVLPRRDVQVSKVGDAKCGYHGIGLRR